MNQLYIIKAVQRIPVPMEVAWKFFSGHENLFVLTPSWVRLELISNSPPGEVYEGQVISYRLQAVPGLRFYWTSRITRVQKEKMFADKQVKGPYRSWEHVHSFKEVNGGVEMTDIIEYSLPYGVIGWLAGRFFVKRQLKKLFTYRYLKIRELFGSFENDSMQLEIQ